MPQATAGPARKMKRRCRLSREPSPQDELREYDFSMRGQLTVQVRRIERAGSWPLPSRTVRRNDEPRRPHGGSSCAMKPEFTGQVILRPTFAPRPGISHVLFDFDGTLSLIRQGWPEVMVPMFTEVLPALPGETEAERGGAAKEPLWYKHEYLRRLDLRIKDRIDGLRQGTIPADDLLVHGARRLLENLKDRGLPVYLASGTDEIFVKQEAELLGLTPYFGHRIYGAQDDFKTFSKKLVIARIIRENGIRGEQLLSFGDGYVEIENTREAGGLAVAVASDEANNGSGQMDEWKRERLSGAGADVVIPDFRDAAPLLELILGR